MCGFIGLYNPQGYPFDTNGRLLAATSSLRHRGPDGRGQLQSEWFALGHTRLAVIDTSDAAQQPMTHHRGRFVIVFNGEIYNYKELYEQFCRKDKSVNGDSDTAVLLSLFERFNKECVKFLNGMFSFVIVDVVRKSVFMCRDRFGEKPLYWARAGKTFVFGSELKALKILMPSFPLRVAPQAVALYHTIGSIPPPHTIYEGVMALPPGHWIEIEPDGQISEGRYWSVGECLNRTYEKMTYQEIKEETHRLLLEAVKSRMVSDVEVGLFLSGGYDSGSLLCLVQALHLDPIKTLCLDFSDERFSEYALAQVTSQQFNGKLARKVISADDFLKGLGAYFSSMDQPTSDGYNTFFVSRVAKEFGIKVWLSGVGGDELFGGYPFFKRIQNLKLLSFWVSTLTPRRFVDWVAPQLFGHLKLSRLLHLADGMTGVNRAYQACRNLMPWRNVIQVLTPIIRERVQNIMSVMDDLYIRTEHFTDDFQRACALESTVYMRSQLLRDMDNFSMAHSIELRAPFLDHRLFEHVLRIPQYYKRQKNRVKPLLEDALPSKLPSQVRRQGKRGFTFPVEVWLKRELAESFEEYALNKENEVFWDLQSVNKLWNQYLLGNVGWGPVWNLYAFSRWFRDNHESM